MASDKSASINAHLPSSAITGSSQEGSELVPLSEIIAGKTVRLTRFDSCRGLAARLSAMGIVPGVEITVLKNAFAGPVIVHVQGTKWILGRGEARKMLVRPAVTAT